jgi:hypothetical protein
MTTLNNFMLFTVTCVAQSRDHIVTFPLQKWLGERAALLSYTYIARIVNIRKMY